MLKSIQTWNAVLASLLGLLEFSSISVEFIEDNVMKLDYES